MKDNNQLSLFTSYRRQDSNFARDRQRNSRDQIPEDLKIRVIDKIKNLLSVGWNLMVFYTHTYHSLTSVSHSGRMNEVLTASILSGSERRAAPIPPCKRSEVSQLHIHIHQTTASV